jgi:hypothetical protein
MHHTSVVFSNRLWVIGGYDRSRSRNDVWSSTDGLTWTQATANAPWAERGGHTSVVFNNRLWVIGGYSGGSNRNDVWSSVDGVTWTQATGAAPWAARWNHTSVVFDNRLWVIGGDVGGGSIYFNDLWFSPDGITWNQTTLSAPWTARRDHTSVVFDNRLWVIGGYDGARLSDVWSYGAPLVPGSSVSGYRYLVDSSPDTIPSATASFSASREISVLCNALGEHWFHVLAIDTLGNESATTHYRFEVLDAAPTVTSPTHPTESDAYDGVEVILEWTTPLPNVVRYFYAFNGQPDTEPTTATEAMSLTFDSLAPGVYWFHLRSEDDCGFLSPVAHRRVTVIGPELEISGPVPAITNSGPVTWTLTYTGAQGIQLLPEDVSVVATGDASGTVVLDGTGEMRTISLTNITGDGTLTVSVAPGTASDAAGNEFGGATGDPVTVDNTPPAITVGLPSQIRTRTGPVEYMVTYSGADAVTLSASDVTLVSSPPGGATGTVSVLGSGLSLRTVRIDNITGDGTLRPQISPGTASDLAGNMAPGATGVAFTVDNTPSALVISGPSLPQTNTGPVKWTLQYAGANTVTLSEADITLIATGTAEGDLTIDGSGLTRRTIIVSNITGDGTLAVSVAPGTATDAAGNLAGGATGEPVTVDNTPPVIAIGAPSASSSGGETVTYTVTYTGADAITLRAEDITLNTTGDAAGVVWVSGSGALSRTVSIVYPSGYGTIGFSIAAGTARDAAGNLALEAGPSGMFSVAHHTLRMRAHGWGTTTPTAGAYVYTAPEEVTLYATPLEGAQFLGWDIDGVIHKETPHTLTMDRDYLVTARFTVPVHTGDWNGNGLIELSELVRLIQLFNAGGFGCQDGTEDGYAPNAPDRECTPHSSDYMPHDWQINLQELLRLIQFYNSGGYHYCPEAGTEDGFCPGPPTGS